MSTPLSPAMDRREARKEDFRNPLFLDYDHLQKDESLSAEMKKSLDAFRGSVVQILVDHPDLKQREAGTGFIITKPDVDTIVTEGEVTGAFKWKDMDCNPFIVLTARRLLGAKPVPAHITIRFFYDQPYAKNPTKIEECECSGWFDFPTTDGGRLEYAALLFKLPKQVGRSNRILRLKPIPLETNVQMIDDVVSHRQPAALLGYPEGSFLHGSVGLLEEAYGEGVVKVKHSSASRGGNAGSPILVWSEEMNNAAALLVHYRETMGISFFAEAIDLIRYKIAQGCKAIGANAGVQVEVEVGSRLRVASAQDMKVLNQAIRRSAFGGMSGQRIEELQEQIAVELGKLKPEEPKRPPIVDRQCLMVSTFCCAIVFGLPVLCYIIYWSYMQAEKNATAPSMSLGPFASTSDL